MDVKFIILVIIGLITLLIYIREMYILNKEIDNTQKIIIRKSDELKTIIKSEASKLNEKFSQCSSDIVRQFRTMNSIEEQKIIHMSECDRFVESDGNNENEHNNEQFNIVHLSDTFKVDISNVNNKSNKQTSSYMSNTENDENNIKNDTTSQEITFGSRGTELTQQNNDKPENDNISNATSIPLPASEKSSIQSNHSAHSTLGKITTYTKQQLIDIATKYNIPIHVTNKGKTKELTKKELYIKVKMAQNDTE